MQRRMTISGALAITVAWMACKLSILTLSDEPIGPAQLGRRFDFRSFLVLGLDNSWVLAVIVALTTAVHYLFLVSHRRRRFGVAM